MERDVNSSSQCIFHFNHTVPASTGLVKGKSGNPLLKSTYVLPFAVLWWKQHAGCSLLVAATCFLSPDRAAHAVENRSTVSAVAVLLLCVGFGSKFLPVLQGSEQLQKLLSLSSSSWKRALQNLLSPIIADRDWLLDWFCHAASLARELNVDLTSYYAVSSLFYLNKCSYELF